MIRFLVASLVIYELILANNINHASNEAIVTSMSQMSQQELQMFNNMFLSYEGSVNGSRAKALVSSVISSNASSENKVSVQFQGNSYEGDNLSSLRNSMPSSGTFTVSFEYDNNGRIQTVVIQ